VPGIPSRTKVSTVELRSIGYDFHLTALFLVPICWAAWDAGRRAGLFLALVCTVTWLMADLATGHAYKHPGIPYWNALMLLAFFLVVVHLLCGFQNAHQKLREARGMLQNQNERLEETVRQRTASLEAEIEERKRWEKATLQAERLAMVKQAGVQLRTEFDTEVKAVNADAEQLWQAMRMKRATRISCAEHSPVLALSNISGLSLTGKRRSIICLAVALLRIVFSTPFQSCSCWI
jgi:hypothetical protein